MQKMHSKKIIIIGAGGHGHVVADIAKQNNYSSIEFLDDNVNKKINRNHDIIGAINDIYKLLDDDNRNYEFFVAIGDNLIRKKIINILQNYKVVLPSLIHPKAVIDDTSVVGQGSVIMANVVVNSNSIIGDGCIINSSAVIEHNCIIHDYTHISPGVNIAGSVEIGSNSWIGVGCNIINNLTICDDVFLGAGTTVISNIYKAGKYVDLPLRRIGE